MIEPIILIRLNKNIINKRIPNGVPVANVTNILENNTCDQNNYNNYYNNNYYYYYNFTIGTPINT